MNEGVDLSIGPSSRLMSTSDSVRTISRREMLTTEPVRGQYYLKCQTGCNVDPGLIPILG